jgi:hypothetical protein
MWVYTRCTLAKASTPCLDVLILMFVQDNYYYTTNGLACL